MLNFHYFMKKVNLSFPADGLNDQLSSSLNKNLDFSTKDVIEMPIRDKMYREPK